MAVRVKVRMDEVGDAWTCLCMRVGGIMVRARSEDQDKGG